MNKKISKEVCNKKLCKVNDSDKTILRTLYESREGLRVNAIIKITDLKQSHVYKRLSLLRKEGLIESIFPVWKLVNGQVDFCRTLIKNDKIFELHNLSYVVKLVRTPDWWNKRKNYLMKVKGWEFKNINFGKGGSNPYQQLINENWVVQCYPESVIVIARKRYYSNQPYDVIIEAMNDFYDLWEWFEERMRFKFFLDGVPQAFIRNNDFNRMKDQLAEHCKKDNHRFLVEIDKNRKVWVDYSEPFGKEANYPQGQEKLEKVTKDILMKESYLPSEITQMVGKVAANQMMFNKNFESHVEAIQTLSQTVKELREEVKNLKKFRN